MGTEGTGAVPSRELARPAMEGVAEHQHSRARHGDFGLDGCPAGNQNLKTFQLLH